MKEILISKGKITQVDDEDYEKLSKIKWFADVEKHTTYVWGSGKMVKGKRGRNFAMHNIIVNVPKGMVIDHIDGNGLNNQKYNLRVVTPRQNYQNLHIKKSSKFLGVTWNKAAKKWQSLITINNKSKYLGLFDDELEAATTSRVAEAVLVLNLGAS